MWEVLELVARELRRAAEQLRGRPLPPIAGFRPIGDRLMIVLEDGYAAGAPVEIDLRRAPLPPGALEDLTRAIDLFWNMLRADRHNAMARADAMRHEALQDPEIGGERGFAELRDLVARHTNARERDELLGLFSETGLGDHPVMLRFLRRVARHLAHVEERFTGRFVRAMRPPIVAPDHLVDPAIAAVDPGRGQITSVALYRGQAAEFVGSFNLQPGTVHYAEFFERANRHLCDAMLYGTGPAQPHLRQEQTQAFVQQEQVRRQAFPTLEDWAALQLPRYNEACAAAERGMALLKSWLSPEQLAQYEREWCFVVIGGTTGRRYRIRHGAQLNIDQLDRRDQTVSTLCFAPRGDLCVGDIMLAQKIALEADEERALAVANSTGPGSLVVTFGNRMIRAEDERDYADEDQGLVLRTRLPETSFRQLP